jgi:hypothetical protein
LIFVSACFSQAAGEVFQTKIPHVVSIANDKEVSNLISRSFFSSLVSAVFSGASAEASVEAGLRCAETHPLLGLERQARQRAKFVYYHGKASVPVLKVPLQKGNVRDRSQVSQTA